MSSFIVEVSARHAHLCQKDVETLFGPGAKLTVNRMLSQPGEFLSNEKVDVVGPKNTLKGVSVLGPERPVSQVEVSTTDTFALGVPAVVKESGNVEGSPGIKLVGPSGTVELACGLMVAKRHVHMTPEQAAELGVQDKQIVSVAVDTDRPVIFGGVVVRVKSTYAMAMHVDTDEANAASIPRAGAQGKITENR
ncbi:MAG: phosphate propanoyltransferase [Clostridiales bacterium]|jgi:putative phosphotransacetylase|nr:phosphate propanoyltransferase [Clostridiales bacterium]